MKTKYAIFDKDGRAIFKKVKKIRNLCVFEKQFAKKVAKELKLGIENKDYHFAPILEVEPI